MRQSRIIVAGAIVLLAWNAIAVPPSLSPCVGDCDGDGAISIDDLVLSVSVALGRQTLDRCSAVDRDGNGIVGIAELVAAVAAALRGCAPPTTATQSPTRTPLARTATPTASHWRFENVTAAAGIAYRHRYADPFYFAENGLTAGGVAAGDFDRDGWIDLYAVQGDGGSSLLLRNRGDGSFEDVAAAAGVEVSGRRGTGAIFADVDGDGWLDLLVLGIDGSAPILFRNRGGSFEDVSQASGLSILRDSYAAAFADYDRDGDIDLFITHWGARVAAGESSQSLWRNDGEGVFADVSLASGVTSAVARAVAPDLRADFTFTPNFADIDNDGWPDLLLSADFGSSKVLRNDGDGTFSDWTDDAITDENGMGGAVGDFDGDGDLDWFVSSIFDPNGVSEGFWGTTGNRLYGNRGDGTFVDVTDSAGVRDGGWGWGTTFADLDNDGWLDLYLVNGWREPFAGLAREFEADAARLFVNRGDGSFVEMAAALAADDRGQGRGVVAFDYDNDGDLDLFIANNEGAPALLRNDAPENAGNFLAVELRGAAPNTYAVGARIEVEASGRTQMRELRAGGNFQSQNPMRQHFGLGPATLVDEVRVTWPDGTSTALLNVAAGQTVLITEAGSSDLPPLATP